MVFNPLLPPQLGGGGAMSLDHCSSPKVDKKVWSYEWTHIQGTHCSSKALCWKWSGRILFHDTKTCKLHGNLSWHLSGAAFPLSKRNIDCCTLSRQVQCFIWSNHDILYKKLCHSLIPNSDLVVTLIKEIVSILTSFPLQIALSILPSPSPPSTS